MAESSIEWTDATWNPTTGCTAVSPGCKNCYAFTMTKRLAAMGQPKFGDESLDSKSLELFRISSLCS